MIMPWLLTGLGLVILLGAGDALVRGAVNLSLHMGIPALIVSLTIVAFGTSAPELLVAISSVIKDVPGIALGNVVGSNTANILLVLGLPAILAAMDTRGTNTRKSYLQMIAATFLFIALSFFGVFTWWSALILLAGLALVLGDAFRVAQKHRQAVKAGNAGEEDVEGAAPSSSRRKIALFLIIGLIGLPLGAELLVRNASIIARELGVGETAIGLTLVAIGTSLPELATTVMAAIRRQADVALGNVIGSNIFNLLAIIGVAALIAPIPLDPSFLRFDLCVMLGASLLLVPFVFLHRNITRTWGVILTLLYVGYVWIVLH